MDKIRGLFNSWAAHGHDEKAEEEHSFAVRKVLSSLAWKDADSYLDIGCGNGYTIRFVSKMAGKGRLVGLDFSEKMIEKAKELSKGTPNAAFVLDDFTGWDAQGARFDKIFSMEAFYYFQDVASAVKKARRLLNEGGTFACVVDFYSENKASLEWPKPENCGVPMQEFSMAGWKEMFREAGFSRVEQYQLRYPEELAKVKWQAEVGSLVNIGMD